MSLRRNRLLTAAVVAFAAAFVPLTGPARAQTLGQTQNEAGIFTCTDARGRTLTADRPIPDCSDRTQRELGPSGVLRRTLEPTYTSQEQAKRDERVRHSHALWDGVALPVGHPWWNTHYPPNGWRCRCRAFAVSERDLARYEEDGVAVKRDAPPVVFTEFTNRSTGEVSKVPVGIDPGFAYNPGKVRLARVVELQRNALDAAPPEVASALVRQVVQSNAFSDFLVHPRPQQWLPVGVLGSADAAAIRARSTTVMLSDETVAKQARQHPDIAAADYTWVQRAIDQGERLQDGPRAAIYLLEQDGWVAVVKATETGQGVFLQSFRRLSSKDARRDREVGRLRDKAQKGGGGADGGASQSA